MKTTLLAACAALVLGSLSATPATARDDTPAAKQSKPATHAPLQGSCTGDKKKHIKVCTLDDPVSGLRFVNWGGFTSMLSTKFPTIIAAELRSFTINSRKPMRSVWISHTMSCMDSAVSSAAS